MTHDDDRLAAEIITAAKANPRAFLPLLRDYYEDLDRLDRTPRTVLLIHVLATAELLVRYCPEMFDGDPPRGPRPS